MESNNPKLDDKPPEVQLDPEVEELWSSRALLLVLVLLILSFWVSYYLKVRRIKTVHETLVALFAGMVIGLIVRLSPGEVVQNMISFKSTIMMNVLLPPIILASGYDLKEANFFRNFGVILTFAFCGTFISAVIIGALVYIWALLGLEGLSLGIIECLLFGSTLSATDPVTVLAIFNTLKVDPKLYSIIFGESLLNDAVAIVMFETLSHFHGEKVSILSFFHGVGIFLLVFLTSMALGVIFGLSCSLMLKHSRVSNFPEIESCLVLLIAYTSYFFSNALTMSGIVSLLFCGITLKHYAYHNMSRRTQRTTKYMFTTLSSLCENFIFIYLGLSLFTVTQLVYKPIFILVSALAVCVARYCAVFPISKLVNVFFRKARGDRGDELPHSYQMMIFWAGLRGAVGVALAAGIKGESAIALRTTVLVTVVLTMVIFGGTTSRMIEIVGIRTGVDEEIDSSDEEGVGISDHHGSNSGGFLSLPHEDPHRAFFADSPIRNDSIGEAMGLATASKRSRGDVDGIRSRDSYDRFPQKPSSGNLSSNRLSSQSSIHSTASQETDDEVLPSATPNEDQLGLEEGEGTGTNGEEGGGNRKVWRDGQWFTVLDEHYLLPVFSNATASRKQATRKAMRNQKSGPGPEHNLSHRLSEGDLAYSPRSTRQGSPWDSEEGINLVGGGGAGGSQTNLGGGGGGRGGPDNNQDDYDSNQKSLRTKPSSSSSSSSSSNPTIYRGSFTDALSALVNPLKPPSLGFGSPNKNSLDSMINRNQTASTVTGKNSHSRKKRYSDYRLEVRDLWRDSRPGVGDGEGSSRVGSGSGDRGGERRFESLNQTESSRRSFDPRPLNEYNNRSGLSSAPPIGFKSPFLIGREEGTVGCSTGTSPTTMINQVSNRVGSTTKVGSSSSSGSSSSISNSSNSNSVNNGSIGSLINGFNGSNWKPKNSNLGSSNSKRMKGEEYEEVEVEEEGISSSTSSTCLGKKNEFLKVESLSSSSSISNNSNSKSNGKDFGKGGDGSFSGNHVRHRSTDKSF